LIKDVAFTGYVGLREIKVKIINGLLDLEKKEKAYSPFMVNGDM
jgi:hypothetical protein